MKKSKNPGLNRYFADGFMKRHKQLNFFISSVAFLILSFGLLNSPVFADGCQTTTWGRQTTDYRQMFKYHAPTIGFCGCVIGYCWGYFTGYSDTITGSLGPVNADEIVVGGLTKECVIPIILPPSQDLCYTPGSGIDYPETDTTIAIYLDKLPMG